MHCLGSCPCKLAQCGQLQAHAAFWFQAGNEASAWVAVAISSVFSFAFPFLWAKG
jgi:hypothetical protein